MEVRRGKGGRKNKGKMVGYQCSISMYIVPGPPLWLLWRKRHCGPRERLVEGQLCQLQRAPPERLGGSPREPRSYLLLGKEYGQQWLPVKELVATIS